MASQGGYPTVSFLEIDGKVLSGEAYEEYCKDHGLCKRCAKVQTHERVVKLFGRGKKWEPLTLYDEKTGDYTVYKGFCLQPNCYTIGQAKRLLGESGNRSNSSGSTLLKFRKKREKRRPGKRRPKANPETGSVMSGVVDDYSISSGLSGLSGISGISSMSDLSGISGTSGISGISGFSFRKKNKKKKRSLSRSSSASSIDSHDFSDENSVDTKMTPRKILSGQPSPIVAHRVEQMIQFDYFTVLDLSKVELRREDIDAVVDALAKTKTLESVALDRCKLRDDGVERIAGGLENGKHIHLKKISLRQNSMGNRGAQSLNFLFQASPTLEEVDLSENSISSRGASSIFSALHANKSTVIHSLNLSQNEIWNLDDGSFLRHNKTLKVLNLDGNFMHDEGVEQIAKAIAMNKKSAMKKLYLGWNGISDDGATALAKMMEVNVTLQVLGLAENDISNAGARAILSSLAVNTSVREISGLYHNQIDRKFIIVAIKRLLHRYGETSLPGTALPVNTDLETEREVELADATTVEVASQEYPSVQEEKEYVDYETSETSEGSVNWASQLYSNEPEEKVEVSQHTSSLALEAIERWDWGTFGIEEIEASRGPLLSPVIEVDSTLTPQQEPEQKLAKRLSFDLPADRITVYQSAPLAYFDRKTSEHHGVPLLDFEYEGRALKEALADKEALGADIELAFENATSDNLAAFFSQGLSRIMHFSCHGQRNCMALENGFGYMHALPTQDLKRFVSEGSNKVQVVFVSSCHASFIARSFIAAGIPHVVCCQREAIFRDDGPVEFSKAFYQALAKNKTLQEAFDAGIKHVQKSPLVKDTRNLSEKYQLLPKMEHNPAFHDVNVFFESPFVKRPEISTGDSNGLPKLPDQFVGREVDMYELLESLRVDDVIRVGGVPGSGKASVISAVSRYILDRPKSFQIQSVFWLPPPKDVRPEEEGIYSDLCRVIDWLVQSEDDIWDEQTYADCRERIMTQLQGIKSILVIDGRAFTTEAGGENLERFLTHLLNKLSLKIILLTAYEGSAGRKRSKSQEDTIITIGDLDFKGSALLFGNSCKYVSNTGNPVVQTADEFYDFLVPPSVRALGADNNKELSRRQEELFKRMGKGNPKKIIEVASNYSGDDLSSLLRFARRPEVQVSSAGELEAEMAKHTASKEKAINGKNFLRAQGLMETLEELVSLKATYPSLTDLQDKERELRKEFSTLLSEKKFDSANQVKRTILALKKTMLKEKLKKPKREAAKYKSSDRLKELEAQMERMLELADKMKQANGSAASQIVEDDAESASFTITRGEVGTVQLKICPGSLADYCSEMEKSGIIVWTNESCDLATHDLGKTIIELGAGELEEELSAVQPVADTSWGPVKCPTGEALLVGPKSFSKLNSSYIIFAVTPLTESNDDDDWDGDARKDEDALHYLDTGLRTSYRSSFQKINEAGLDAVAFRTITTKETGDTYERTLRVGLQTLIEEAKLSCLTSICLFASSSNEAKSLMKMAVGLGLKGKGC